MFMMPPYVLSGLSIPVEDFKFSLPIYMFSVNILVQKNRLQVIAELRGFYELWNVGLNPVPVTLVMDVEHKSLVRINCTLHHISIKHLRL